VKYHLSIKSSNPKTGKIPVSTTAKDSCPPACPFMNNGCYADNYPLRGHWDKVSDGTRGDDWPTFIAKVSALPDGIWRHNQAGDLPGVGNKIDAGMMRDIVTANGGRMGFTYTHKPMNLKQNRDAVAHANANGFRVNLSANTLAHADELVALAIGPVCVVLDAKEGERHDTVTPAGNRVVTCPATYRDDVTCSSCKLCARSRDVIVGFPVHGAGKAKAGKVAGG
jgi:hypothetical protein